MKKVYEEPQITIWRIAEEDPAIDYNVSADNNASGLEQEDG